MRANFNKLVNTNVPVLVDFYADWCGPCKMQAPILSEVAREIGQQAKIVKIDVDKNQEIASRFQVRGVPTLILFKKGEVVWKSSGVANKAQLIETIRKYM